MDYIFAQDLSLTQKILLGIGTTAAAYITYRVIFGTRRNLPPGPRGLPLLGAILHISENDFYNDLIKICNDNKSDIVSFYIGPKLFVVLNSWDVIKECFVTRGEEFANRGSCEAVDLAEFNINLGPEYTAEFKAHKKFGTQAFRAFATGNKTFETNILAEFHKMEKVLSPTSEGSGIDPADFFPKPLANAILSVIVSKEYEYDDPILSTFVENASNFVSILIDAAKLEFLPRIFVSGKYKKCVAKFRVVIDDMIAYLDEQLEEHIKDFNPTDLRDMMDTYLKEVINTEFDRRRFACNMVVFMPDAIHSLTVVMSWIVLFAALRTEEVKRVQEQLDDVVGTSGPVRLEHRSRLPLVEAFIMEATRLRNTVPIGSPRLPLHDNTLRGYSIPKEAEIMAMFDAVHKDPELYPDPEEFKLEHFLDADGNLAKTATWIPFGLGPRMCMGAQFSKMEAFLLIANILHRYDVCIPEGTDKPTIDVWKGQDLIKPHPYKVCFKPRL